DVAAHDRGPPDPRRAGQPLTPTQHRHPRGRVARALRPAEPPSGSWLRRWAALSDAAPPGPPQPRASPRRSAGPPGRRAWRPRPAAAWRTPAALTGLSRSGSAAPPTPRTRSRQPPGLTAGRGTATRSEERRVGEERRSGRPPEA